jgi:hypothetical protein
MRQALQLRAERLKHLQ